ncbi:MAG TPA: ABC transporter permease, partial [Gemmatimonadaceae bacterium]|nr:ABC transporter permease [Gemmatimonadaceae bacterium]
MSHIAADLRYALRALRAKPSFTLVALLSLTLGIGANTTVFSIANGLLFSELPVPHPDELARIVRGGHSPLDFEDLTYVREHATTVAAVMGERLTSGSMTTDDGRIERFDGALVTGDYFTGMQLRPALGRFFAQPDNVPSPAGPVLVVSYNFWQTRFGGDPLIVGRRVRLNEQTFTIIAVAPQGYTSAILGWHPAAWIPLSDYPAFAKQTLAEWNGSIYTTVRLKPGVPLSRAAAEMNALAARLRLSDSVKYSRFGMRVLSAKGIEEEPRQVVTVMTSALLVLVSIVLIIACANVANLMLARATGRRQEIAVRLALGASRARLIQQLLVESFVLAFGGAFLGLISAFVLTKVTSRLIPAELPIALNFAPDLRVVTFAAVLAVVTALVFGLVPALGATRADLVKSLKDDIGIQGLRRSRLRSSLLVTQVTMALVLLSAAALFARGLSKARSMDPGFRADGVVDLRVDLRPRHYSDERGLAVYRELLTRARALPGVKSATLAGIVLLEGSNAEGRAQATDAPATDAANLPRVSFTSVASGYFETLTIPIVAGRGINDADITAKLPVAVITEAMAARLWPSGSPIGRSFKFAGESAASYEVVGVARDVKYYMAGDKARPLAFLPIARRFQGDLTLQLRTSVPANVIGPQLEAMVRELEPTLPPTRAKPM